MDGLDDEELEKLKLPPHIRDKLAQLQLDYSEGDLTEKGFLKKKNQLLKQYTDSNVPPTNTPRNHKSRRHRRTTRNESRYHSEIRTEAVQQALSQWSKDSAPKPMKRRPSIAPNGNSKAEHSDSSSDGEDTSTVGSSSVDENLIASGIGSEILTNTEGLIRLEIGEFGYTAMEDSTISTGFDQPQPSAPNYLDDDNLQATSFDEALILNSKRHSKPLSPLNSPIPPVRDQSIKNQPSTSSSSTESKKENGVSLKNRNSVVVEPPKSNGHDQDVYVNSEPASVDEDYANTPLPLRQTKVSQKIQQLLLTLQLVMALPDKYSDPFGRQYQNRNMHTSSSQIVLRPKQNANRRPAEFRHSLNNASTNSILNSSPLLHFINENNSIHNVNLPPARSSRCLSACSTSAANLRPNRPDAERNSATPKTRPPQEDSQHLSRRAVHNSVNQLRLSNKNYIWPRNYSQQMITSQRSRSTSNRPNDRATHSMSQSICSLTPSQLQQQSSSTKLETREAKTERIVNSDLHLSLSGQTSMLMLNRKHEYGHVNDRESNKLARSMQSIAENKATNKSNKASSVEFQIEGDGERNDVAVVLKNYAQGIPYQHVNDMEDQALVLEFFDPLKNDQRRAEIDQQSRLLQQDGFRAIQQQLKNFDSLRTLRIGRRKTRIPLKSIENLDKIYSHLTLRYYQDLQRRPHKKPLQDHYIDYEEAELDAMSALPEPSVKAEGPFITPSRGEFPAEYQSSTSRSVEAILEKHSNAQGKANVGSVLDQNGKISASLTYGKLFSRSIKIAHMLKTKTTTVMNASGHKEKIPICKPGDCVALVYPNTDPLSYLTAFYGCLLAGAVPISVEVPTAKRDAGLQQFGFLLSTCGVRIALTSESCLKGLPKFGSSTSSSTNTSHASSAHHNYPTATTGSGGSNDLLSPGGVSNSGASHSASQAHNPNDVIDFKGWPRGMQWLTTENLNRPSKDFSLSPPTSNKDTAYIEHSSDVEGTVKGVCVSREAMLGHAKALSATMLYKEGEVMVCVLDFKKEFGFWHSILAAIFAGMSVVFVPYSVMKLQPAVWMTYLSKNQKSSVVLLKSRDLHWSLMASRDQKELQLEPIRAIVVADGANPWSLSSCDQFVTTYQRFGLKPTVLCPSAGSPEVGTISIRRPVVSTTANSGRGILSMLALSHSVVRVNNEPSLNSLAVQDAGKVIAAGQAIVIKLNGESKLCKTDEVGEICLHAPSTASSYYGLKGLTNQTFEVSPTSADGQKIGSTTYVRSGLVGFLGPCGLVFVIGNKNTMMNVSGRWHSADDLIATALSVEPSRFVYRGRIAVFSVKVLRDERICMIAEQKSDTSEEVAFQWMAKVLQAVDSIHSVGLYCIALVAANQLPKLSLGGICVPETRQRFIAGNLHPTTLLMCPQSCVLNLPKPREQQPNDVGPAAMFVGNIVQGARIASASGRLLPSGPDEYLVDILKMRAQQTPEHVLYSLVNSRGVETESMTCGQLWRKAERIGALLLDKAHLSIGDHVALIFAPGLDLIAAFYGCLVVGLVPVCIRAPSMHNLHNSLITVRMIVDVSKSVALLSTASMIKLLKSKEASHRVSTKAWPTILDINDTPSSSVARKRTENIDTQLQAIRKPTDTCYLDFAVSTTGQLAGIVVTASGASNQCKSLKMACELYPSRHLCLCLDPYSGLGFALWTLAGVYSGHRTTLIPPSEMEANPAIWFSIVSQHNIRDTFCSYSIMKICVRELAPHVATLKEKGVNLACLRNLTVVAEERPRHMLCKNFTKLFAPLNLAARCVSTSFGSRTNTAICLQGAASPESSTVYVDVRALRHDRIALVEKGAPHSICLMECGALLPGVQIVIANPETKGQCADTRLGEIWVSSAHNAAGYFSLFAEDAHLHTDHFNAKLTTGDTKTVFARTGYLGFLRQTQAITADGQLHEAVFVVGALDETLMLRGLRYHPVDIEITVSRAHKRICESAVFFWTNSLVVVAETDAPENEALDLIPAITSSILEEHHQIVGVIMLVDPHTIPINSRGEKQRMHLRDLFVKDSLNPIYVAYSM